MGTFACAAFDISLGVRHKSAQLVVLTGLEKMECTVKLYIT